MLCILRTGIVNKAQKQTQHIKLFRLPHGLCNIMQYVELSEEIPPSHIWIFTD
jgi:hypothetical protein